MELLRSATRIVVKVGTSVLTERGGDQLSPARVRAIAAQVAQVHRARREVIVVTSGAIAAGMRILGYRARPKVLHNLQAASAVGQGRLMHLYEVAFARHGFHAAQLLLTKDDLRGQRRLNAKATLATLLAAGTIPVINENDSVSTDEIRVGDNDQLAAEVAVLAEAQLLIILTDVDGFHDPRTSVVIPRVSRVDLDAVQHLAKGTDKVTSAGGMQTKLLAAQLVMDHHIPLVVANGSGGSEALIEIVLDGRNPGTVFTP